jgi:hypothetical protein
MGPVMQWLSLEEMYGDGGLPTLRVLLAMPRWALVAYAGHAARLGLPLLGSVFPEADPEQQEVVHRAVRATEVMPAPTSLRALVEQVSDVLNSINDIRGDHPERSMQATYLMQSVFSAVHASYAAAHAVDDQVAKDAQSAAESAVGLQPGLLARLNKDFRAVRDAAERFGWDDDTPAPLTFFQARARPSYGRLLLLRDLMEMDRWPIADPAYCVMDAPHDPLPEALFFISHAWLDPLHPDPEDRKLAMIKGYNSALLSFRNAVESVDLATLDRSSQIELVDRRYEIPIILARHWNDYHMQRGGWRWLADGDQAAPNFLAWLKESITEALNASVWIDSFALPQAAHRERCEACRSAFWPMLAHLPQIIARSTCLALGGLAANEQERGWMTLETSVASSHVCLVATHPTWDAAAMKSRLNHGQYRCSVLEDGRVIQQIWALACCRSFLEKQDQVHEQYSRPSNKEIILDLLARPLGLAIDVGDDPESLVWRLDELFKLAGSPAFREQCSIHGRGFSPYCGRVALTLTAYCATSILLGYCWMNAIPVPSQRWSADVLAQACIYVLICRWGLPPAGAAINLIVSWKNILGIDASEYYAELMSLEGGRITESIQHLHDYWLSGEVTEVTLDDFDSLLKRGA